MHSSAPRSFGKVFLVCGAVFCAFAPGCDAPEALGAKQSPDSGEESVVPGDAATDTTAVTDSAVCLEVTNRGGLRTDYTRKTWDDELRVLTAESSASPAFDGKIYTLGWRYGTDGRLLAYAGFDGMPFQMDYTYDEQGNLIENKASYVGQPDLQERSDGPAYGHTKYVHEYGPTGRLVASTASYPLPSSFPGTALSARSVYSEDEDGRCARIETTSVVIGEDEKPPTSRMSVETFFYEDEGRTVRRVLASDNSTTTNRTDRDDAGRVTATYLTSGGGKFRSGTVYVKHIYLSDGSERVETHNGLTDVSGDEQAILTRSAACLAIDAQIGMNIDTRCRLVAER